MQTATAHVSSRLADVDIRPLPGTDHGWFAEIPGGCPLTTPAVVDGAVVVGGGFGSRSVYAFDIGSKPLWRCRMSDDGPSAPVIVDNRVVLSTESCSVFVLDAATGEPSWARWLGDPLTSQPAVAQGAVFVAYPHADGQHRLAALSLDDGRTIWELPVCADVLSAPIVAGGRLFFATLDGSVSCATADGVLLWTRALGATSAPWISGDTLFVAQRDPADWSAPREGFAVLSIGGEPRASMLAPVRASHLDHRVQNRSRYSKSSLASDTAVGFAKPPPAIRSQVVARHLGQGTVRGLWEFQGSRPAVRGDRLFVTHGSVVRALDRASGELSWEAVLAGSTAELGGHLGSPPALGDGIVVLGTTTGDILVLDEATGARIEAFHLGDEIRFQPCLVDGRICVGTTTGKLVCIETGDGRANGWPMWGGGPGHNGPTGVVDTDAGAASSGVRVGGPR